MTGKVGEMNKPEVYSGKGNGFKPEMGGGGGEG